MIVSAVLTALGLVSVVVLFLQPWASCPGVDDSSAGCPVQGAQVVVQQIAVLVWWSGAGSGGVFSGSCRVALDSQLSFARARSSAV